MDAALAGLVLLLAFFPVVLPSVRLDAARQLSKELLTPGTVHEFTAWNALSRIDVVKQPQLDPQIFIDAQAMTVIASPHRDLHKRERALSTAALQVLDRPSVVIIGPGGGLDVQDAFSYGAREVTAVEINPIIIDLVTDRYASHVGNLYDKPNVHLVRDEGRSFIERMGEKVDIIQVTLIDTWAASVSGAYSLSENYLYTSEAYQSYLNHLTPRGMVSITRWWFEIPRLMAVAHAGLVGRGVAIPAHHLMVLQRNNRALLLTKAAPFTLEEANELGDIAEQHEWQVLFKPLGSTKNNFFAQYLYSILGACRT